MDKKALGQQIRRIRKEAHMPVDVLAKKAGISASYLREIENGRKMPALPVFVEIVNALKATTDELLVQDIRMADTVMLNSLTRRMARLPKDKYDMLLWICDTLISGMKNDADDHNGK